MTEQPKYKFLGNFNAAPDWAAVGLKCDACKVEWIGCWDNAACPQCGNHDSWDRLMKERRDIDTNGAIVIVDLDQGTHPLKFYRQVKGQ